MENFIMVLLADIMRMKCVVAKDPFVGTQIRILECQDLPAGGRNAKTERKRANRGARNFNVLAVVRRYPRGTCVSTTYTSFFPHYICICHRRRTHTTLLGSHPSATVSAILCSSNTHILHHLFVVGCCCYHIAVLSSIP